MAHLSGLYSSFGGKTYFKTSSQFLGPAKCRRPENQIPIIQIRTWILWLNSDYRAVTDKSTGHLPETRKLPLMGCWVQFRPIPRDFSCLGFKPLSWSMPLFSSSLKSSLLCFYCAFLLFFLCFYHKYIWNLQRKGKTERSVIDFSLERDFWVSHMVLLLSSQQFPQS